MKRDLSIDVATISAFQHKDNRAWKIMFDQYGGWLISWCFKRIKDVHHAEDLATDIMLKVAKTKRIFDSVEVFERILYRSAMNACNDFLKSEGRNIIDYPADIPDHKDAITDEEITAAMIGKDITRQILDEIDKLPKGCRKVYKLFYIHGYTYEEIGEALKMPDTTVRSNVRNAIRHLKEALPRAGFESMLLVLAVLGKKYL